MTSGIQFFSCSVDKKSKAPFKKKPWGTEKKMVFFVALGHEGRQFAEDRHGGRGTVFPKSRDNKMGERHQTLDSQAQERAGAGHHSREDDGSGSQPSLRLVTLRGCGKLPT
jgi:hypothetical protein